ncbi:MAG TPA: cytochrome c nitrite reductase small subunit [Syntrophobacteria bacterium]|nr:cytochrome c nitrite reductase small subunit [Syntrophobacteria bacterium]
MSLPRAKRLWLYLAVSGAAFVCIGAFVSFGPPKLFARSTTPEFCASCHVMEAEYDAWFYQGAHRRTKCVDCHLPNDNIANHLAWKGIEGMEDAFSFYSGQVPENIRLSEHGEKMVQENCLRCHEETVARISVDRKCWECHRRVSHKHTGSRETLSL